MVRGAGLPPAAVVPVPELRTKLNQRTHVPREGTHNEQMLCSIRSADNS